MKKNKVGRPREGESLKRVRTIKLNEEEYEIVKSLGGLTKVVLEAIRLEQEKIGRP